MFDVTTVMVASEFGRTMRGAGLPIDQTGTNHNQFSNSILIGGKGIRAGMVLGASDLRRREGHGLQGAPRSGRRCSRRPWACPSTSPP